MLSVVHEKINPILGRKEVDFTLSFEKATPSNVDVKKMVAEKVKSEENLVVVTKINTEFGMRQAKITAHIYNSEADLKHVVKPPKPKKEKVAKSRPAKK
jgi:small subunit ribosomal protein S24e